MTDMERKKTRISKMQEEKKLSYHIMRLKFLIMNYCTALDTIIFVIDNLNNISMEYTEIKKVVNEYLDVFEYLKSDIESKIKIYTVICARPVTFRQLKTDYRIESFIQNKNIITK